MAIQSASGKNVAFKQPAVSRRRKISAAIREKFESGMGKRKKSTIGEEAVGAGMLSMYISVMDEQKMEQLETRRVKHLF